MKSLGLPLLESYPVDIAHTTLVRFTKPLLKLEVARVENICKKYPDVIGRVKVNSLTIGEATWKMSDRTPEMKARQRIVPLSSSCLDSL
jgi:hypothetical protein